MYNRVLIELFGLGLFLVVSFLYEKKRKVFSTGYLFIAIVLFVDDLVCPGYYTASRLMRLERDYYNMPADYFSIFASVYFICMFCILLYLLCLKTTGKDIREKSFWNSRKSDDVAVFLMALLLVLPLMSITGTSGATLIVPALCYFCFRVMYTEGNLSQNLFCIAGLLLGLFGIYRIRDQRYLVVQYLFAVILVFLCFAAVNDSRRKGRKVVPIALLGVICVLAYGMISEIIKLNRYWGKNYSFAYELTNLKSYLDFASNQVYRIFGIWTILGGNIIGHTKYHGYYYGLSYIKSIAPRLGLEYVSLPTISAQYIAAGYAQPGLLAEGYANFGISGAVVNLLLPFVIAEVFLQLFLKKRTPFWLVMMASPFVKVLMDGGTVNSIIAGVAFCLLTFGLYIILKFSKISLTSIEGLRIHLFRKEKLEPENTEDKQ